MNKDFSKDLIKYLPSKLIPGLFGISIIPVFTWLLDPLDYGRYVLVITTIGVLGIFISEWIGPSIIRFYAEYEARGKIGIFNGTIIKVGVISIFLVVVGALAVSWVLKKQINGELLRFLHIGLIIFAFGTAFDIMMQVLIAKRKAIIYSFFSVWRQCICIAIGLLIAVWTNTGILGLLWGSAFGFLSALPFLFRFSFSDIENKGYSKKLRKDIVSYGLPLLVSNLGGWVLSLSDRYIISFFRGNAEVGLYTISYTLADRSIALIVSLLVIASQAIIMQKWEREGVEQTRVFVSDITKMYLIIALPATVGLSLLSKPVVALLASKSYIEGYKIIPMVAAGIFFFGLQRNFQIGLLFDKKTKLIMYILILCGAINIFSNLLLVPKYGFIAAGYTTLLCYFLFAVITVVVSRKYFIWQFPFQTLMRVVVSCCAMSVTVLFVMWLEFNHWATTVCMSMGIGGIVYFAVLILMKEFGNSRTIFVSLAMWRR